MSTILYLLVGVVVAGLCSALEDGDGLLSQDNSVDASFNDGLVSRDGTPLRRSRGGGAKALVILIWPLVLFGIAPIRVPEILAEMKRRRAAAAAEEELEDDAFLHDSSEDDPG
jgi:hypothetical protein